MYTQYNHTVSHFWNLFALSFLVVCFHDAANVTVLRSMQHLGDEVYINYTVERRTQGPITFDITLYERGKTSHQAITCINDSVSFPGILSVEFKGLCEDPVLIVNMTATVKVQLEMTVGVSYNFINIDCNTILIGPQREYS